MAAGWWMASYTRHSNTPIKLYEDMLYQRTVNSTLHSIIFCVPSIYYYFVVNFNLLIVLAVFNAVNISIILYHLRTIRNFFLLFQLLIELKGGDNVGWNHDNLVRNV